MGCRRGNGVQRWEWGAGGGMGGSDGTGHQGLWGGGGAQGMQGAPRVPETPTQHLGSLPLLVRMLCSWGPRGDSSGGGVMPPK